MIVEMGLSGFLFLFIIIADISSVRFGYKNISDLDSDATLQKILDDPKIFQISTVLMLIEHSSIIALAVMLFLTLNPYNLILAVIWTIFRIGEGLIQIYNKRNYWGLLNIARQYSGASSAEKKH